MDESPRAPSTVTEESYVYIYLDNRRPGKYMYESLSLSFLHEPFYEMVDTAKSHSTDGNDIVRAAWKHAEVQDKEPVR
jgi:hypothetical protein